MPHRQYGLDYLGARYIRRTLLSTLVLLCCTRPALVLADIYFNPRFLTEDQTAKVDLSGFEKGQELPPGTYHVDVYLNEDFINTQDITFTENEQRSDLVPCLTSNQLSSMGVNTTKVPAITALASGVCMPLTTLIGDATSHLDVGRQRLELTVPQDLMRNHARGYIPPELWDNGITAGLINYNFTGNKAHNNGHNTNYAYLNLQSGLNFDAWRLRDNSAWSYNSGKSSGNKDKWQHINTWLERDVIALRSRLTFGDSYTNGDIFDGINFRGVQLASDDNMLPESQRGFAPVIHGIARGTAQVTIKQNGYEIYQNTLPPGPFTIDDIYTAGNGGDLEVTIKEADGSSQVFTVPWATVPILQREGHTRYAVSTGEYRNGGGQQEKPKFFQGVVMQGLPADWTLYGGAQLADRYRAFNLGTGRSMGYWGAISLDITQTLATLPDDSDHHGQSIRFLYNKTLNDIGTHIQLVGYRYSTSGYYSFSDTAYRRMSGYRIEEIEEGGRQVKPRYIDYYNLRYNKRDKTQLSVSQQLGERASLYLNGSHQTYWNTSSVDKQLQLGLNTAIADISWMVSYSLTRNAWQHGNDQMLALNVNIPFSHWLRSDSQSVWRNASASYSMSHNLKGRMTNLAGLYGTLLADNNLSYSVQTGYTSGSNNNNGATGYTALNYRGGYGNANLGYSHSDNYNQLYYGLSGGILAHANGITLSQPLNDTVVLVKAPGAGDVKVENQTGVYTDWRGYAVLPYATNYRENRIALNTNTLADNVDLEDAVVSVIPTHGAIVRATFVPHIGVKILLTLTYNGKPIPFGAVVTTESGQNSGIVADNGQVYLSGMPLDGKVRVKWGNDANAHCQADYHLPAESQQQAISQLAVVCR